MKRILAILVVLMLFCGLSISTGRNNSHGMITDFEVSVFDALLYPQLVPFQQQVFVEIFSATWCGWCFYAYDIFDRLSQEYGLALHNIRYYNQDSLAMKEAPERTGFYKVTGYPTLIVNGDRKMVGANEQSYPEVMEWVEASLKQEPQAGIFSYGLKMGNQLKMIAYVQSFSEEETELRFMSLLMEDNVKADKDKTYHYVARTVFPSYEGLVINLSPKRIYRIEFSFHLPNIDKAHDYKVVSFLQHFESKKIFNSSFYEVNSLEILKTEPNDFSTDVPRDNQIKIQLEEQLLLPSIKNDHVVLMDQFGSVIHPTIEYDRLKRLIIVDPQVLLEKNSGYTLLIQGGRNSFTTSSRKYIRDYYCLPFQTGSEPQIVIEYSSDSHDFGSISPIDEPSAVIEISEKNGHPLRLKASGSAPWLVTDIKTTSSQSYELYIEARPLFMKTGTNEGEVLLQTILGNVRIPVTAYLESSEYPTIRIDAAPFVTSRERVSIVGKTNGYRLYMNNKEVKLSLGGTFSELTDSLVPGMNIIVLRAMNMQRKETQKALVIFRAP